MQRVWTHPLRQQLFVALLFLLAPMILAAAGLGYREYRETVERIRRTDGGAPPVVRLPSIERELTGLDRMGRNLSNNPVFQALDAAGVEPLLGPQRQQRPSLVEIVLVDTSGQTIGHGTGEEKFPSGWSELMSPVVHKGMRVVTPLKKTASGTPYITVAYPVADPSGAIVGAVLCHLNPQLLLSTLDSMMLPAGSVVTVMEKDGRVIARNLEPERYIGQALDAGWTRRCARTVTRAGWRGRSAPAAQRGGRRQRSVARLGRHSDVVRLRPRVVALDAQLGDPCARVDRLARRRSRVFAPPDQVGRAPRGRGPADRLGRLQPDRVAADADARVRAAAAGVQPDAARGSTKRARRSTRRWPSSGGCSRNCSRCSGR